MGRRIILAMCFSFAAASTALAQSGGIVTGRVTSADGAAPIPGATVILLGTTRGAVTDTAGRFRLAGLPAGEHP
jgi:iron complex outermembrane receptor protein